MKHFRLLLALFLVSCAPAFEEADGRATFTAKDGRLIVAAETSISYGSFAVRGDVTSAYETGGTNGYTLIRLPEGDWGTEKQVGTFTGPVEGFGTVVLLGGGAGLEVTLE